MPHLAEGRHAMSLLGFGIEVKEETWGLNRKVSQGLMIKKWEITNTGLLCTFKPKLLFASLAR